MRRRGDAAASFAEGDGRLWRLEAGPEAAATDPDRSPRTLPASHSSGAAPPSPRPDSPRCALPELCRPPPRPLGQVHRRRCALRGGRGAARRRRRTGAQAGPGECLFQFLCSSNNNISRLEKMVWTLARLGERLREVGGFVFHQFPTVERLVQVSEQELWEGFGYRYDEGVPVLRKVGLALAMQIDATEEGCVDTELFYLKGIKEPSKIRNQRRSGTMEGYELSKIPVRANTFACRPLRSGRRLWSTATWRSIVKVAAVAPLGEGIRDPGCGAGLRGGNKISPAWLLRRRAALCRGLHHARIGGCTSRGLHLARETLSGARPRCDLVLLHRKDGEGGRGRSGVRD